MNQYVNVASLTRNKIPWYGFAFLLFFLILIHVRLYQYAADDAFIHFRVAHNLSENGTPYYNTNEVVKVSTSSGWSIFLAILLGIARLFRVDNNLPLLVAIVNALFTLWGMVIYTKILETLLSNHIAASTKILFQACYLAFLIPSSVTLMETPFALLIAGLAIYFLLILNPVSFALLGVAAYLRLELLVLLALTALFIFPRGQFRLQTVIGYLAIGFTPFLIYDLYFFHTAVPQSIIAKSNVYSLSWSETALRIGFSLLPASPFSNTRIYLGLCAAFWSIIVVTILTAFMEWKEERNFWSLLFCFWGLLTAVVYILGHTLVFEWYIPLYTIPVLVACFLCAAPTNFPGQRITKGFIYILFLLSTASLAATLYATVRDPGVFPLFEPGSRVKTYRYIGAILNEEYANATLLTSEIGGLGYSFEGKILDAAGLASPDAVEFHPMKVPEQRSTGALGAIPPEYVKAKVPDLIVSYDVFAQALLSDNVIDQYNIILFPAYLPEDALYSKSETIWGSNYLRIYIRKDLPISEKIYALAP